MSENDTLHKTGLTLAITGALLVGVAGTLFVLRTSKRRQRQELLRIDTRLRGLGVQAKLAPWFTPAAVHGPSGGLNASIRF